MFSAPVFETTGLLSGTSVITDTQLALRRMNSTTGGGVNIIRRDSVEKNTPPVEHPGRKMKKAMNAFFQKSWRVIRRACCCVYVDVEDEDFSDPQPGPSWAMEGQRSAAPEPDDRTESAPVSGPSSPETADAKTKQAAEPEAAKPESSQRARAESASESPPVSRPSPPRKAKAKTNKRKRTKSVSPSSSTHPITDEPAVPKQSTELESSPADTLVTDLTEPVNAPFASLYDLGKKLDKKQCDLFVGTRKSDGQRVTIKVIPKLPHKRFVRISGTSKPLPAEVALNVKMRSPRVLNLLQWFDEPIEHVLVFEYVHPCKTLEHFIKSNGGRLDERQARDLIFQAVLAAKDCLDQDVFHRTIVLKNILINTTTLKIKLSDFSSGVLAVTDLDRYIAEISTVWFVGDVLYRMLHGRPPYLTAQGIVTRTLNFDSSLSGECCDFLSNCLNTNSARRASVPELVTHMWFHGVQV